MANSVAEASKHVRPKSRPANELVRFEVFGRRDHDSPLTHIGSISAPNQALAESHARYVFTRPALIEMCIAPHSEFVTLTEQGSRIKVKVV